MTPETARSVLGIGLIVAGVIVAIMLVLPADGLLNGFVAGHLRATFGQGAWFLAVLLIVGGVMVERTPRMEPSWLVVAFGGLLVFVGGEGLIHLLSGKGGSIDDLAQGGGRIGYTLADTLTGLLSGFGAFVILGGLLVVAGLLLMFELTLRHLLHPVSVTTQGGGGRHDGRHSSSAVASRAEKAAERDASMAPRVRAGRGRGAAGTVSQPRTSDRGRAPSAPPELPRPDPSPAPMSSTVWSAALNDARKAAAPPAVRRRPDHARRTRARPARWPRPSRPGPRARCRWASMPTATAEPEPIPEPRDWVLPPVELLTAHKAAPPGNQPDHARNIRSSRRSCAASRSPPRSWARTPARS